MKKIKLIVDSASDLTQEEYDNFNIEKINFTVSDNIDETSRVVDTDELYAEMLANPKRRFKTACPSPMDYCEAFEKAYKDGMDVICVTITSKFSGSYNSAMTAKNMCLEKYPDAVIEVIDSLENAVCYSMLVLSIKDMINDGFSIPEIVEKSNILKTSILTSFLS